MVATIALTVGMAIVAALAQPANTLRRAGDKPRIRPVVAQVVQAPDDARSIGQVCAAYNIPKALCDHSEKCAAHQGHGLAGRSHVVRLILTPTLTCPDLSDLTADTGPF